MPDFAGLRTGTGCVLPSRFGHHIPSEPIEVLMKSLSVHALLTLTVGLGVVGAQTPTPGGGRSADATESQSAAPFRIVRNDPALAVKGPRYS